MPAPLGSITVNGARYALGADEVWSGPDAATVARLNAEFNADEIGCSSSAALPIGYDLVSAAAEAFGDPSPVLPRFPPRTPENYQPGAVY